MWSSGGYFRYFLPDEFLLTSNDINTGVLFSYFIIFCSSIPKDLTTTSKVFAPRKLYRLTLEPG